MSLGFYSDKGSIYVFFRKQKSGKSIKLKYYPGIVLGDPEKDWDSAKQRAKDKEINKKLVNIEKAVNDILEQHNPFLLTNISFGQLIEDRISNKSHVNRTSFFEYCQIFYEENKKKIGERRSKSILTAINKIKEFSPTLSFDDIDRKFYREFVAWLEDHDHYANYVGSIIKDLKRILNYATENGANANLAYRDFKKPSEDVFNIYLTEAEIEQIYNLNVSTEAVLSLYTEEEKKKKKHLSAESLRRQVESIERARKLFVIGCWTGLRVENYLAIDPDIQIDLKEGYLHAIANKNGPKLKIPLHRLVRQIVEKDGFPGTISQQKLNDALKKLGQLAGIKEVILYTRTVGGQRKEFSRLKYEMITSHTARRSFASNLLIRGIPKQYIMSVTGHSTEKSFNKYTQAVQKDMMSAKLKDYDVWG
ncbi:MAG: site-specific integrase [Prolixibacteraceae bacterium]